MAIMTSLLERTTETDTQGLLWETAFLTLLRSVFFFAASRYVNVSLFADLRSVSEDSSLAAPLESPTRGAIALEELEEPIGESTSSSASSSSSTTSNKSSGHGSGSGSGSGGGGNAVTSALLQHEASRRIPNPRKESLIVLPGGAKTSTSAVYTRSSTVLFCLAFSESCMLFTLLLFGDAVTDRARTFNWSLSLLALLALIVFIIPLSMCLLFTNRTKSSTASVVRTLILTLIPFGVYLLAFYQFGSYIAGKIVVEGSTSLGVVNALLSRICVPGVVLIASLSGAGAVNTAWESYEWRSISSAEAVTETQILAAERSLYRTRLDLQQRLRALNLAEASAAREAESAAGQSLLSRWATRTPAAAHLKSLQIEVTALESIETSMTTNVARLKRRKEMREMGRTFKGRLWLIAGWLLSVYCVWRVFVSCLNLVFGYSRNPRHPDQTHDGHEHEQGTDLITSLLARLTILLNVDIDIAVWSRLLGLVLIASIILANMRSVLASVSRVFRATSTGISASFMLLFLAQLMATYLLTSLISLPSTPGSNDTTTSLLDTLPEFAVFSRLFDSVFLIAAGLAFMIRFVGGKLREDGDVGGAAQYV